MRCSRCWTELRADAAYCHRCGLPAAEAMAVAVQAPAAVGFAEPVRPPLSVAVPRPKGLAVGAMVCGLLSVLFCWLPVGNLALGVLGFSLGGAGTGRARRGLAGGRGMAVAGIVLGVIGAVWGLLYLTLILMGMAEAGRAWNRMW